MGLFRKKKKEKSEVKGEPIAIEYRVSGYELFEIIAIATVFVMLVAWISFILASLLYFLSFSSVFLILVYGYELVQKRGGRFGMRMLIPIAGSLFFLALSLSPNDTLFLVSAYGCAIFSPLLAFVMLRKEMERSKDMREVFGYE